MTDVALFLGKVLLMGKRREGKTLFFLLKRLSTLRGGERKEERRGRELFLNPPGKRRGPFFSPPVRKGEKGGNPPCFESC